MKWAGFFSFLRNVMSPTRGLARLRICGYLHLYPVYHQSTGLGSIHEGDFDKFEVLHSNDLYCMRIILNFCRPKSCPRLNIATQKSLPIQMISVVCISFLVFAGQSHVLD
eukprot:TRINITY_DN10872_c1_g2_i1.p1 TRINITY_DN10872_c1_g2~~TRINITY_DN10872_c1_g2_i1.p1  ORF type:complete len:110 (+),score=4.73 TRINITY_DN10872_c1_g2_i1:678-1007(+)